MRVVLALVLASDIVAADPTRKLVIEDDEGRVTVVPLLPDREITIGRVPGNLIRLTQRNVSPRHARLTCSAAGCTLEDLASTYGVFVDGKRIAKRVAVRDKQRIQIGSYQLFVTADGVRPPVSPATLATGKQTFAIDRDTITIGSAPDNQIVLADRSISPHHARIERVHAHVRIVDLASDKGVRVNGEYYYRVELVDGDTIVLGATQLRFTATK